MEIEETIESLNEQSIESLVAKFNACETAAARTRIEGFVFVASAKALGKLKFKAFCDGAGLNPKSSTTRKYALIGAEAGWLLPIADHLPPEWTTIYTLVTLGEARAQELIESGCLHPQVTAKELVAATTAPLSDIPSDPSQADGIDEATGTAEPCIFQVNASDLSDQDRLALYQELEERAVQRGLTVTGLPDALLEILIIEREAA
jgi:hypothetical protein